MYQCRRCGNYLGRSRPSGPVVCDECFERAEEERERREQLAARVRSGPVIVGVQPAVCEWCNEPFLAPRADVRFCCTAHRSKAWRERQRQTAAA